MSDQPENPLDEPDEFDDPDVEVPPIFDVLKQLQPGVESRVLFRTTVAKELATQEALIAAAAVPRWRKVISTVLPYGLGTGVGIAATLMYLSFGTSNVVDDPRAAVPVPVKADDQQPSPSPSREADTDEDDSLRYDVRASETYLCGIGKVNSVSQFILREKE